MNTKFIEWNGKYRAQFLKLGAFHKFLHLRALFLLPLYYIVIYCVIMSQLLVCELLTKQLLKPYTPGLISTLKWMMEHFTLYCSYYQGNCYMLTILRVSNISCSY